jgi:F-type H+-transporting ATPase subunit b
MMGIFLLASEVEAEVVEHGFGLNTDILETNVINLVIIIGVLFYFGRGFLGNVLSERRNSIATAIKEAEQRKKDAEAALSQAQQKLAQAQAEAQQIRAAAEERAKQAREAILAQGAKDLERLRAEAARDIESEQERVIKELRQRLAAMALQQVESQLQARLDDYAQNQLVDRSIALLGGR